MLKQEIQIINNSICHIQSILLIVWRQKVKIIKRWKALTHLRVFQQELKRKSIEDDSKKK